MKLSRMVPGNSPDQLVFRNGSRNPLRTVIFQNIIPENEISCSSSKVGSESKLLLQVDIQ